MTWQLVDGDRMKQLINRGKLGLFLYCESFLVNRREIRTNNERIFTIFSRFFKNTRWKSGAAITLAPPSIEQHVFLNACICTHPWGLVWKPVLVWKRSVDLTSKTAANQKNSKGGPKRDQAPTTQKICCYYYKTYKNTLGRQRHGGSNTVCAP